MATLVYSDMRGLATAGRYFRFEGCPLSKIERNQLQNNMIAQSPAAGTFKPAADICSGLTWTFVEVYWFTRQGPPVTSTNRPAPGQSRRWPPPHAWSGLRSVPNDDAADGLQRGLEHALPGWRHPSADAT